MNLSDILNQSLGGVTLGEVFSALIALVICLLVIRILMKMANRMMAHSHLDTRVQKYITGGVKLVLYAITAIIVVGSLGIDMTSLVALLSVGSLGITLAAEDILGNMAGGIVILSPRPFDIGDFIEASGVSGTVDEIKLNHTKLLTPDGLTIMLPNRALSSSQVTNYSALGRRRIGQKITASYDAPTESVFAACREAIAATPHILTDPAPAVRLTNYGSSSIEYTVYCWTSCDDYWDSYFALMENLRTAFAKNKVEMTYDHLNIHVVEK